MLFCNMKKVFKYASALVLGGALSVMVVSDASAQRGAAHVSAGGGGGRGGASFSGGGSIRGGGGYSRSSFALGLGLNYNRFGYGNYYGYPNYGFFYSSLPFGYYPFYMGSSLYYYSDGIFYQPYNDGYAVTAPPVGAAVPGLPKGTKSIMIDNQQFFEYNGVYYKVVINDKGDKVYVVAGKNGVLNTEKGDDQNGDDAGAVSQAPRVGDIVDQLPEDARRVTLNGQKYYVTADDIYLEETTDSHGKVVYRIASVPDNQ